MAEAGIRNTKMVEPETTGSAKVATPPKRFAYIDELRGLAVLLVVFVHVGYYLDESLLITRVSRYGQYGVQLFFMLSAFTLCHSMDRLPGLSRGDYRAFFVKRFFRIAPLYYAALVGYTAYSIASHRLFGKTPWTEPADYSAAGFLTNLTFTNGLWPPAVNQVVPGGWSIGCEFLFYAIFPFLFFATRKRPAVLVAVAGGAVALSATLPWLLAPLGWRETPGNDTFYYYSIINQLPCFMVGMLYFHFRERRGFAAGALALGLPALVALALIHEQQGWWIITPLIAGVMFTAVAIAAEKLPRLMLLAHIGECSFSIYLVHFIVTWNLGVLCLRKLPQFADNTLSAIGLYLVVTAISFGISRLTYRFVELPFISLGHKVAGSIKKSERLE
ncbi:acyltransferase family protein [Haloferula sargassicola]|uniref:Acyltransferase 3 domain-containing protein n=1 Tax=Haloferula sargassicola TaxID=490096 RepID=A0ABP9UHL3_9BACT